MSCPNDSSSVCPSESFQINEIACRFANRSERAALKTAILPGDVGELVDLVFRFACDSEIYERSQ